MVRGETPLIRPLLIRPLHKGCRRKDRRSDAHHLAGLVAAALLAACDSSSIDLEAPDAAGVPASDAGLRDAGLGPDLGARRDAGRGDIGFSDPSVLLEGLEPIGGPLLYITVRGTRTSTLTPVVILPTGPMPGQEYLYEPTEFLLGPGGAESPNRLLVYLDLRATGRSSFGEIMNADVSVENHVRDVENLVLWLDDFLGSAEPVDLLGHGYGAGIAMLYAARFGDRVRRLVLANPYPANIRDHARWNEAYRSRLDSADLTRLAQYADFRFCLQDFVACSAETWNIIAPTWMCPENRPVYASLRFEHWSDLRVFNLYINEDLREDRYDWSRDMGQIRDIPTTIISGPCDAIPDSTPLTYTASIAGSVHEVVPGSGHFTLVEQPEAFARIVRRALGD